jgi:two-component system, LytTR family, sensor kinase
VNRFLKFKLDHVLFWALTIFFHAYTQRGLITKLSLGHYVAEIVVRNSLLAGAIYTTILIAIPALTARKIARGVTLILATLALYVVLKGGFDQYVYELNLRNIKQQGYFHSGLYHFSIVLFYVSFASTLYLSKQWYLQRQLIQKIKLEKLNTELEYLKAQINPHFLFNSINTIYFQIAKENQAARDTLNKFADMLRYQLYECNQHEIEIEKEVHYLKNYVDLQRLRRDEHYSIEFACAPDVAHVQIPPLLLMPFVENAFKHLSSCAHKKNEVRISLTRQDHHLRLSVYNTKDPSPPAISTAGGIGLKNVRRRLDLLFDGRYQLDIQNTADYFSVTLDLPVS